MLEQMQKAVIYLRVSSKGQEENGFSLDAQEKLAIEYATKHRLKVVKIWNRSYRNTDNTVSIGISDCYYYCGIYYS